MCFIVFTILYVVLCFECCVLYAYVLIFVFCVIVVPLLPAITPFAVNSNKRDTKICVFQSDNSDDYRV
jgi:hypothetical protein